ncbi:MAG: c-type cytochrome [Akkermansiaceae bacterium]
MISVHHFGSWKWLVLPVLYLGFVFACTPQQEYVEMPVPDAQLARSSGKPLDELGRGYALAQVHCAQCHEFKLPKDMQVEEWHTIVPGMAWNAGLSKEDEDAVLSYLVASTRQIEKANDQE